MDINHLPSGLCGASGKTGKEGQTVTIRNWQESDEEISYSWPIAVGVGIGTFAGAMAFGNYTDVTAAAAGVGGDSGLRRLSGMGLLGPRPGGTGRGPGEVLYTQAAADATTRCSAPQPTMPKTLGLTGLVAALEPTSLVSYAELGERFGLGPRKPKTAKSRAA